MAMPAKIMQHASDECGEVAKAIESIADAAMKACTGALSIRAICLLVRDNLPHGSKSRISVGDVQDVLEAAAGLGRFVNKKPPKPVKEK